MPALAPPLVPQQAIGKYVPQLDKIRNLYEEGRILEFYQVADKTMKEIRKKEGGDYPRSADAKALFHWIGYYQLSAPLLTFDELENQAEGRYTTWYVTDFSSKVSACKFLCRDSAERSSLLFGLDEKSYRRRQVENLAIVLAHLSRMLAYCEDWVAHEKENADLKKNVGRWTHVEEMKKPGAVLTTSSDPLSLKLEDHLYWRGNRLGAMRISIENAKEFMLRDYIRKLVKCFPKQGHVVQSYVRRTGLCREWGEKGRHERLLAYKRMNPFPKNLHLTLLLERTIPRDKDTEWVFFGLHKAGVARKLEIEWFDKYREVLKRWNADDKRLAAEAAAKEAAKNVRSGSDFESKIRASEAYREWMKNAGNAEKVDAGSQLVSTASSLEKSENPGSEKTDSPKADNGGAENGKSK
ncbi:MAG: hypothetical protein LBG65_02155 [Puniceicoccales bacterium]|nr:hypothetical protein [Puniceicoccales bacterium]